VTVSLNGDASVKPMKDIFIINNTFYNNGGGGWGGGIGVENPDVQNLVIRNNIVSQNVTFQIEVEPNVSMSNLTVDHNLIHGYRNYGDEIKGDNPVEGDPLFVNVSSADFHLQAGSPAIDAGSSTGAPSDDYEGNSRPQGSGYDIGAFEYQSGNGGGDEPEISLSRTTINFAVLAGSTTAQTNTFSISNSGTGTLNWSVSDNAAWLSASPASGTGSGVVTVTMDPSGVSSGSYTGTVTVSSSNASNSPQTVTVDLTVSTSGEDQPPFGQFATPVHGSTVRSSVPVTGWALDDISVESVKIYRDPVSGEGGGMVYIGDALLVEGARPDIETAYPGYPNNSRAGWGYMMLTNFLPNGGNGTFTLYAVAADSGGHETTLGTKTITCDNANAVKPFGAIDTPVAGGTASGTGYRNGGWVLTPLPNSIPTGGSTINVYVDGVDLGHPSYNIYRSDIASLFPGYSNSNGAHAYLDIDTTAFSDGVHTIAWTAQDSAGNSDGIGSRYFTINNAGPRRGTYKGKQGPGTVVGAGSPRPHTDDIENINMEIKECERLELPLIPNIRDGYLRVGEQLHPLPIGSTLDRERGIFYWLPGPGFTGNYQFVFITEWESRTTVTIKILPRFLEKEGVDQ
ncbi:MAG: BACON domain-containing protein, partial [bacterium]|nr:BACON domain-containing protein [bacterium]